MKAEEGKTIAVIGAGAMGQQIAMNTAIKGLSSGYRVILCDSCPAALEKAEKWADSYLAGRVAELEDQVDDLQFKLDRIKNNPVWKASAPFRRCMHFCIRQVDRVKNCGSLSGVIDNMKYKANERKAMCHYGTESFPDDAEREHQKNTVFDRMVKVSVLTPLWNTPENFLREMIESVQAQTYQNWELCLADGSDDDHA